VIRALTALARARHLSQRARLVYRNGGGATTHREVEVLGLGFQDSRWYALVHCHLRRAVRLLRVDRVVSARATAPTAIVHRDGRAAVCHVRASRPAILAALVESLGREARLLPTGDGADGAAETAREPGARVH
jgi:predicted DNA-binding transcriptional regulator YafY